MENGELFFCSTQLEKVWKEMVSMVLQDRDYTKYLNEEEKRAFELEEKIENRRGDKK